MALVDSNNHQIQPIQAEANERGVAVTIVVDPVHVLEYLWGAAWSFFDEGDPDAEAWVRQRALAILQGHVHQVAAGIRRRATAAELNRPKRSKADQCAKYLVNKTGYLDYPSALAAGWPIATGIIEGACRYLVAARMHITGARWSVEGAEAVLKLRAVRANGDFDPLALPPRSRTATSPPSPTTPTTPSQLPHSPFNRAAPIRFCMARRHSDKADPSRFRHTFCDDQSMPTRGSCGAEPMDRFADA